MADTRLIQGRYRLIELIGRGGMGEVWGARDESLGRRVAVKCLKPMGPEQDTSITRIMRERFRREARVAAQLQHRGVTVVHDFGEHEGVLYLVMELLAGRNLGQVLADQGGPLPVADIVDITEQVADALAYTHEQGIVHRDLKPANIMRLTDGTVKICDFGIARLGHDVGLTSKLTSTGIAMGTPHYMSPEQISGGDVDRRSDLYSFGCVLYELATGAPPFDMGDAWAVLVGHRDTEPKPPREHRADLPAHLDALILDLLAKTPDERPTDLRRHFAAARAGGGRSLRLADAGGADDPRPPEPVAHGMVPTGQGTAGSALPAGGQAAPSGTPGTAPRDPRLPAWTKGMTAGHGATGTTLLRHTPARPFEGLTAAWTRLTEARAPVTGQAATQRPTPTPEQLTALADRHDSGLSLGRLGRWEEAGEVHRSVAAEREQFLGPDHPDTLDSRYEVGFTFSRTGRPAEALGAFGRAAEGRERTLGPDHPETLAARQETAYVLGRLGRHVEAHEVYASVLASRERTMGPEHPDTLRCRHNLAFSLSRLGRVDESLRMARQVAAARSRVLGDAHPDTLVTRYEVAYALGRLDRWKEALAVYREVAVARAQALGPDHRDTLAARYEIGICLGRLGRSEDALKQFRGLIEDRTRLGGPGDPETLRARHGLGVNLGRLGRWEEALAEARDVAAVRARALGPDHADTLVSRREVAVALGWLGRWNDALTEYRALSAARGRALGPDHPDTLTGLGDEAHCLEQLGRVTEAAGLHRRIATLREERGSTAP
jgi:tRNA A-37 threonylcarbamoyl transferase component Bud32/tetratricopeptide (TPR) repeat protein